MTEQRALIISRTYEKQGQVQALFVAQISGSDLSGTVFQYEVWLNNIEQTDKRMTSGNAYAIRRAFINSLLDLHENGWARTKSANYGHSKLSFFDPGDL